MDATPCQFAFGVKVSVAEETETLTALVSDTAEKVIGSPSSSVAAKGHG